MFCDATKNGCVADYDLEEAHPLSDSSLPFLVTFEFRNVLEERGKPG